MAACNFSIPFSGTAAEVLAKAKTAVTKQGGDFNGDTTAGNFSVSIFGSKIIGTYTVVATSLEIVIEEKPFLIPCSAIESFLTNQIAG